ncbi:DUF2972 domain-containing protein, partial [Campylobacter sp.]|uniref:DUF2972 domain-containing protein n=1 Tax=Campylobacter sp. TaxID=205 RepID=UPI0026DA9F79
QSAGAGRNSCGAEQVGGADFAAECAAYAREGLTYRTLGAEAAWALNLPLPRRYGFVHLALFGSGYVAMLTMYGWCGVETLLVWNPYDAKDTYAHHFGRLVQGGGRPFCVYLDGFNLLVPHQAKFFSLIDACVPLVSVVRDPVAILRPLINHLEYYPEAITRFNLTFDPCEILDCVRYYNLGKIGLTKRPVIENIKAGVCGYGGVVNGFSLRSRILALGEKELVWLDMSEVAGERAFETMVKLALRLGFAPPGEGLRAKFGGKINGGDFLGLAGRVLLVHPEDVGKQSKDEASLRLAGEFEAGQSDAAAGNSSSEAGGAGQNFEGDEELSVGAGISGGEDLAERNYRAGGVELIITSRQEMPEGRADLSGELLRENRVRRLVIYASDAARWEALRADARTLEATRAWLERYVKRLEEVIREEEAKRISMEAILDYLRENAEVRGFFKRTWDAELADIKQKRPDIVASWKYYAEFERICAGFGGAAGG